MLSVRQLGHHYYGRFITIERNLARSRAASTLLQDCMHQQRSLISFQEESHKNEQKIHNADMYIAWRRSLDNSYNSNNTTGPYNSKEQ